MLNRRYFLMIVLVLLSVASISAVRLPIVDGDTDTWGTVLNDYLINLAGVNATALNQTMVNGTNIYASAINTTHILDSTIGDVDISDTTNLTLGEKITFTLGEIIDNIVDGWIRITGNLNVTGNATISGTSLKVNNQEVCLADGTNCQSSTWNITTSVYLYNNSGILDVNETKLNATITAKTLFPMGEVSLTNNSVVTAIGGANTWTLINASWNGNSDSMMFQNYSNGTLQYTGTETMFFHIAMTISVKGTGDADTMRAAIFKNGVILPGGQIQQRRTGTATDVVSTAIHVATSLSTGDKLNVYLLNENDADDYTVTYANLFAMGMRMG